MRINIAHHLSVYDNIMYKNVCADVHAQKRTLKGYCALERYIDL